MKNKLAMTCFIIGSLLGPVIAHAEDADNDRIHPLTYVKDSYVTSKVKANLFDARMSSLLHIRVETDSKGEVTLSGNAKTQELADQALTIARATSGVTSVSSTIQIRDDD